MTTGVCSKTQEWVHLSPEGPICFGARDDRHGLFLSHDSFNVSRFKLIWRSGGLTCNTASRAPSHWGCNDSSVRVAITSSLTPSASSLVVPTFDDPNVFPTTYSDYAANNGQITLSGANSNSPELNFLAPNGRYALEARTPLFVWYSEDLFTHTETDNAGESCADVYGLAV